MTSLRHKLESRISPFSLVYRLGVGLALREIEFFLGSVHIDTVIGQLAEINLATGHREVFLGFDRNIVRPEDRIAPRVDLVHRDRDDAIAVGVFEREIDPDLGGRGKPRNIEFARRDHDLPLGAIDFVPIDIDAVKRVIGPQALNLL